jgi:hypothetical protein
MRRNGYLLSPTDPPAFSYLHQAEGVTPDEMRARILRVSSTTAEDPDRLAKVAFHADRDPCPELGWAWENIHEEARENYRRLAAAVADVCAQDRAIQPTAHVPDGETRDPLTDQQEPEWFVTPEGHVAHVVGRPSSDRVDYTYDGESRRDGRPYRSDWPFANARPMTPAEVAAFKRDGTRPAVQPTGVAAQRPNPWNWCDKCSQPVDCDDVHDGSEVRPLRRDPGGLDRRPRPVALEGGDLGGGHGAGVGKGPIAAVRAAIAAGLSVVRVVDAVR